MGDLKQELTAKLTGLNKNREPTISDVAQETENMSVVEKTVETARKLAGTDALGKELENKDTKIADLEKGKEKTNSELQEARMQVIQAELGGKIDKLSEALKSGASSKSIGDQITDIKKAANELGLGGSKVSEIKEIMTLVESLNPKKNLAEQVKEAREMLITLQPEKDKGSGVLVEGVPAEVAIRLKEVESTTQITLAKMADERQDRDQKFQLTVEKFKEDREIRRQRVDGEILVQRERNQLIGDGLETVGKAIGRGYAESGGGGVEPSRGIGQKQQSTAKSYQLQIPEGESGTFDCPNCHAEVGVGPTSTEAECAWCKGKYPITRVPATGPTTEPASKPASAEQEE